MTLAIAGGLALIFGIAAIVYAACFHKEHAAHRRTQAALETCRDSHRRARNEADDLQRKVWSHASEVSAARREGRTELAEEIRDAKIEAADAAIKGLDDRLTALDELRETGAIDKKTFEKRDKKLREQIAALENDKHTARVVAQSRIGWSDIGYVAHVDWL